MDVRTNTTNGMYRWLARALLLGLGGAALTYGTLFLANSVLPVFLGARIVRGSTGSTLVIALAVLLVVIGVVLTMLLRMLWGPGRSCSVVVVWWGLFFTMTAIGQVLHGMSLPVYVGLWLVIGAVWSIMVGRAPAQVAAGAAAAGAAGVFAAKRRQTVLRRSEFGRIPPETVELLQQHVATAQQAVKRLPQNSPPAFQAAAGQLVLDHVLRDWWENNNREGLSETDQADMGAFVALAWQQVAGIPSQPEALAVFRAVLAALLGDWLNSWNADGNVGAPAWQNERGR